MLPMPDARSFTERKPSRYRSRSQHGAHGTGHCLTALAGAEMALCDGNCIYITALRVPPWCELQARRRVAAAVPPRVYAGM